MSKFPLIASFLFLALLITFSVEADEISELKEQMNKIQKRIDVLENKREASSIDEQEKTIVNYQEDIEYLKEEIEFLSERQDSFISRLDNATDINLYATLEYENFDNIDSSFDARNIEVFVQSRLTSRLKGFAEIEFERTAVTSAGNRQGEVEVEQGWMEYSVNNLFNFRAGIILVPFGKFNIEHFDPVRDLTDRPIAMRRVVPVTWGEAGAGFNGVANLGRDLGIQFLNEFNINYSFYFINGLTNEVTDTSVRSARGPFGSDNNGQQAVVGRLGLSPVNNVEVGISGYHGEYDNAANDLVGFNFDWDFIFGPLELIGEYAFWNFKGEGRELTVPTQAVPRNLRGGYIQANYHFWFDSLNNTFLAKGFTSPTFTAIVRYGEAHIDDDGDVGTGDNEENRWTIGLNYRPVESFVFKFEYQFNNTKNETLERGDKDGFIASITAAF